MLTLTENASTIVKDITEQISAEQGAAEAGLRITADAGAEGPAFAVAAASAPEPTDEVVEHDGAKVYLDQGATEQLDDLVLDATVDATGTVAFALGHQG